MGLIRSPIVGGITGATIGATTNKGSSMRVIANAVAGLVGPALGRTLLGSWGLSTAGMAIMPSSIDTIILVLIISFFARKLQKDFQ